MRQTERMKKRKRQGDKLKIERRNIKRTMRKQKNRRKIKSQSLHIRFLIIQLYTPPPFYILSLSISLSVPDAEKWKRQPHSGFHGSRG